MDHQLRPASASDKIFLYALHSATMREHIEKTWGWDEAWQRIDFEKRFGQYEVSIIQSGDHALGGLWLESRSDSLFVAELQIMPEWQGQGIGTAVLRGVIARAVSSGLPVELAVLPRNEGARRLYERLGFHVTTMGNPFVYMRYQPGPTEKQVATSLASSMNDHEISRKPDVLEAILRDTTTLGFTMASEPRTGALLAALAASKPGGRLLELGTGTGVGTAWLLAGMDADARLETVDTDADVVTVARRHLSADSRVTFHVMDGAEFIGHAPRGQFDLIYADAWPGKFSHLDDTLPLLRVGGIYVIDDLLPQPNWPDGHAPKVSALVEALERRSGFVTVKLSWASGLMLAVRTREVLEHAEKGSP